MTKRCLTTGYCIGDKIEKKKIKKAIKYVSES